jgi:hypothetical protein
VYHLRLAEPGRAHRALSFPAPDEIIVHTVLAEDVPARRQNSGDLFAPSAQAGDLPVQSLHFFPQRLLIPRWLRLNRRPLEEAFETVDLLG